MGIFMGALFVSFIAIFHQKMTTAAEFYTIVFIIGFCTAYWAMMVTVAAEQFGTNLRATVATSVPNFVRGFTVPITIAFGLLKPEIGIAHAAEVLAVAVSLLAIWALFALRETFHIDLDYVETDKGKGGN